MFYAHTLWSSTTNIKYWQCTYKMLVPSGVFHSLSSSAFASQSTHSTVADSLTVTDPDTPVTTQADVDRSNDESGLVSSSEESDGEEPSTGSNTIVESPEEQQR